MTFAVIRIKLEIEINNFVILIALAIETRANCHGFRSLITNMHSIEFFNHIKWNKIFGVVGLAQNASYARMALLVLILHRDSYV